MADQLIDANYVEHSLATRPVVIGVDGVKQLITSMRRAFPNIRGVVEDQIAEGETRAERITVTGTHEGHPFMRSKGSHHELRSRLHLVTE